MEQEPRRYMSQEPTAPVMSIGNWVVTMVLMIIPLVNIVLLIVWAASSGENPNRKNWAIATLIFMAISFVLWMILATAFAGVLASLTGNMY